MPLPDLSGSQKRVALSRGTDFCAALEVHRSSDPQCVVQVPGRDPAVESSSEKRPRDVCGSAGRGALKQSSKGAGCPSTVCWLPRRVAAASGGSGRTRTLPRVTRCVSSSARRWASAVWPRIVDSKISARCLRVIPRPWCSWAARPSMRIATWLLPSWIG